MSNNQLKAMVILQTAVIMKSLQHRLFNALMYDKKWLKADLNCRPWAYESPALTN